ncbi:hypothetical protein M422DRAFT_255571 [Sphaerobolus stellatus SS14]|uniref:Uncharacterized protein n=1 Tax=Sphaerobolus stellatus (strain SS14) TaxID=990650 RepID=A0A0C9VSG7_SPHS4|nr:hypothetical protein M422DRAFT_255571 [Sphaerobolus stellatus SS14]
MPSTAKAKPATALRLKAVTATRVAAKAASKKTKQTAQKARNLQVLKDRDNNAMTPQGRKTLTHHSSSPSMNSSERDDEIKALKAEIARLKAQKAKKTTDDEPKVPKPPGEAGRDFNLQAEMLLGNKNVQWNSIKGCAPCKTLHTINSSLLSSFPNATPINDPIGYGCCTSPRERQLQVRKSGKFNFNHHGVVCLSISPLDTIGQLNTLRGLVQIPGFEEWVVFGRNPLPRGFILCQQVESVVIEWVTRQVQFSLLLEY